MIIEIKSISGKTLYTTETPTLKEAVEQAVSESVDLSCADFSNEDLQGVNFSGSKLVGANFIGADLDMANFSNANLKKAKFNNADLCEARFRSADLTKASLDYTHLGYADFSNATLRSVTTKGANFEDSDLIKIEGSETTHNYEILITPTHIKIGCQFHSIEKWFAFDDTEIEDLDPMLNPLKFWRVWKPILEQIAAANGYVENNNNNSNKVVNHG